MCFHSDEYIFEHFDAAVAQARGRRQCRVVRRTASLPQGMAGIQRPTLAVSGLTPRVVTESLYALAADEHAPFVPTEVHLITSAEGARRAELSLLSDDLTDNPGISRTTLAGEYLAAARMCEGGLSLWECLALMRQAFVHCFLPSHARERLLKAADHRVFQLLTTTLWP